MSKKIQISDKDTSILVNMRSLSGLLANEETHSPLWLGIAFGYTYGIITQTNPEDHEIHVTDIVLELFENCVKDIENRYEIDIIEELHKKR